MRKNEPVCNKLRGMVDEWRNLAKQDDSDILISTFNTSFQ